MSGDFLPPRSNAATKRSRRWEADDDAEDDDAEEESVLFIPIGKDHCLLVASSLSSYTESGHLPSCISSTYWPDDQDDERKRKKRLPGKRRRENKPDECPVTCELDQELDRALEDGAKQHNLTAINVRNILHVSNPPPPCMFPGCT